MIIQKKYVIFGGSGFLGKSLIDELLTNKKNIIYVITRNKTKAKLKLSYIKNNPNLYIEQCNVNDLNELLKLKIECNYAINFASDTSYKSNSEKFLLIPQMLLSANNILLWANKNVKNKYLFASSGAIYKDGNKNEINFPDLSFSDLKHVYGETKLLYEQLCKVNYKVNKLNYIIARIFFIAGWHIPLDNHFAFGNFLNDSIKKRNISLNSQGSSLRSYLDQRDFAVTIINLLMKKTIYNIYNVGSDEIISLYDLAKKFSLLKNSQIIFKDKSHTDLRRSYIPELQRIKKEKLLSQKYNLSVTINDCFQKLITN